MSEVLDQYTADIWDDEKANKPDKRSEQSLDLVRVYLNGMGRTALLNAEEEVELAKRIEAGVYAKRLLQHTGPENELELEKGYEKRQRMTESRRRDLQELADDGGIARQHLLEANLRLVVSIAKRHQGRGLPFLDLIQDGNLGLIRAVEKFDYTKGFKFSTYATWWVHQAVSRGVGDQARTIRIPVHKVEQVNKLANTTRRLTQDLGRSPTDEELAAEMKIDVEKVKYIKEIAVEPVSLDVPVGETDDGSSLGEFIEDDGNATEDSVMLLSAHENIIEMMESTLTQREALVTSLRFGLYDGTPKSYDQIAAMLVKIEKGRGKNKQLSRERIRHISIEALSKMRSSSRVDALKDYLDEY